MPDPITTYITTLDASDLPSTLTPKRTGYDDTMSPQEMEQLLQSLEDIPPPTTIEGTLAYQVAHDDTLLESDEAILACVAEQFRAFPEDLSREWFLAGLAVEWGYLDNIFAHEDYLPDPLTDAYVLRFIADELRAAPDPRAKRHDVRLILGEELGGFDAGQPDTYRHDSSASRAA